MNDGEHYSTMEKNDDGQEIIKHRFKSGKKVRTLFKSTDFEIPKIFDPIFFIDQKVFQLFSSKKYLFSFGFSP